jgi:hemerythrin
MQEHNLVEWSDRYRTGISLIDDQHKKLIDMTNALYMGCLEGGEPANVYFRKTVHEAVDYVRFHFTTEEKILERINYPETAAHKKEHENFIKEILLQVQAFQAGKKFVPHMFVRYLRDWILTHIAVSDNLYALYLTEMKKKGTLFSMLMTGWQTAVDIRRR